MSHISHPRPPPSVAAPLRRLAALLEQLQRTALTDSLAQLSPTAGDASLSAFNALMGGGVSPTYGTGLPTGGDPGLAASLLQCQAGPGGLRGMLDPQQAQQQQLFAPPGTAADAAAAAAAMLQGQLSDASQLGSGLPGSAAASAAPTPTAAGAAVAPTVFQQRGPSPPTAPLDIPGAGGAPAPGAQPKSQPLMSTVFHPMLQHKPGGGGPGAGMGGLAGFKAEILVDARSNNSPTIPASWGGAAAVEGAQQQQQQQPGAPAAGALPQRPQPPPVHVAPPQAGAPAEQLAGTPREIASVSGRLVGGVLSAGAACGSGHKRAEGWHLRRCTRKWLGTKAGPWLADSWRVGQSACCTHISPARPPALLPVELRPDAAYLGAAVHLGPGAVSVHAACGSSRQLGRQCR